MDNISDKIRHAEILRSLLTAALQIRRYNMSISTYVPISYGILLIEDIVEEIIRFELWSN